MTEKTTERTQIRFGNDKKKKGETESRRERQRTTRSVDMWVKICGTTNLQDARLAIEAGADALGFIFAPSKRRVRVEQVAEIAAQLPPGVERVGVVAEQDPAEIVRIVREAGLTAVQLHMAHDRALTAKLDELLDGGTRLIQVIAVDADLRESPEIEERVVKPVRDALGDPALWGVLLDAAKAGVSGGLGLAFSWERTAPAIRRAVAQVAEEGIAPARLLLAGGLQASNVAEAIATLEPWGVDVCSGVEASPGHKDPDRVAAFLASASKKRRVNVV